MTMPSDDDLVELTTRPNEMDAGLVREVLRAEGIETWQRVSGSGTLGVFGASTFNPTIVLVRRAELTDAQSVMNRRREESVDLDWSEVDVGEPQDDIARSIAAQDDGLPGLEPGGAAAQRRSGALSSRAASRALGMILVIAALWVGVFVGVRAMLAVLVALVIFSLWRALREK